MICANGFLRLQKSNVDGRRFELEFAVGDIVFVKISPLRHVITFGSSRKVALRFVGPLLIMARIERLA